MVLLVERLGKSLRLHSKLDNHHHHHHHGSEALLGSLQAFHSDVSNCLNQILLNPNPGSEILSLFWFQRFFELFPAINKAFAKLVVRIDYPMSKWEVDFMEEYLNYSLSLLELLNSINASISHLGHARFSLSHALSLVEHSSSSAMEHLKAIQPLGEGKACKEENKRSVRERPFSGKEEVSHQALMEMKSIGFWVCGIVLSGLSGNAQPYLEMRKLADSSANSSLKGLDAGVHEVIMERSSIPKEVKEVNDAVPCLLNAMVIGKGNNAAEELKRRLEVLEKTLDSVQKEVEDLFSEVLAGRNELLDILRRRKH